MLKKLKSLRTPTIIAAATIAIFELASTPAAMAQLPNRCVAQGIAMCKVKWQILGYSDWTSCAAEVVNDGCPPEEPGGSGEFVCGYDGYGNVVCVWSS